VPALEWLISNLEEQYGMATKLSITGNQRRLSQDRELAVFHIAQEALSNVKRHSQASAIEMTIDFANDVLTLVISDNGRGFDIPDLPHLL
jgi:signal transduction histidine kinase